MKAVIQRVSQASVTVDQKMVGAIEKGMLILLSVSKVDEEAEADFLVKKLINLRIFEDTAGKFNLSALEAKAEFLVVSQFTLHGDCAKGRRPSFDKAAAPQRAEELYNYFVEQLKKENVKVETGTFGARMDVALNNNGPVTLIVDSPCEKNL